MGETLFIAHRIPFPPDRGDKIRSHHLLRKLAEFGPVHVAALGETEADFAAEPHLAEVASSYCLVRRPVSLLLSGLRALATGKPVSLTAFDSPILRQWIATLVADRPIETVFVFSGQMGQYIPAGFGGRVVIDLCDVDSAKFEAYSTERNGPRAWIDAREARLLAAEEARLAARADATLLVSESEADLLVGRIANPHANIVAVANGIDTVLFDPSRVPAHAALASAAGPQFVFTGQMDYAPNIAAVKRAARSIMPQIRAQYTDAQFHIVGRAPTAEVLALDAVNGTRVWGEVADVRPFLAAADLVLAPLTIARGVQNKVLEAMAMARPVVVTPEAATGIGGEEGVHYAVASGDDALAQALLALLADPKRAQAMGAAAREFVVADKSWAAALAPLAGLTGHEGQVRDAA